MTNHRSEVGTVFSGPLNLNQVLRSCPSGGLAGGKGRIYAIEAGRGLVKIGVTSNPFERFTHISRDLRVIGGRRIGRAFVSRSCTNFRDIERESHRNFREFRSGGEYFRITLEAAISFIESLAFYIDHSRLEDPKTREKLPVAVDVVRGFSTPSGLYSQIQVSAVLGVSRQRVRDKLLDLDIDIKFHPSSSGKMLNRDDIDRLAEALSRSVEWESISA